MIESKVCALEIAGKRTVFRSILEARWATFFTDRGLEWEYEPFKFPIGDKGLTYTPDFRVEGIGIIEVKPYWDALAESIDRIEKYIEKTKERVYVLAGNTPFEAQVAILHGPPLGVLRCDGTQGFVILGGKEARKKACEDWESFRASIHNNLNQVSGRFETDALAIGEVMFNAIADLQPEQSPGGWRGKSILRRLAKQVTTKNAA